MNWMRIKRAAALAVVGMGAISTLALPRRALAVGDFVTVGSNASQENRFSLFHDYSIDAVGLTAGKVPGSAGSGFVTSLLGSWASTDDSDSHRKWDVSFTPISGYDSDPEARSAAKGSIFAGGDLSADLHCDIGPYDANVGSPNQFRLSYDATGAVYEGPVDDADVLQQTLAWSYRRSLFNDRVYLGVGVQDQFTMVHNSALLNTLDAGPSAEWYLIPQASIEINYDYTCFDYFPPVNRRTDEDSDRHTVNLELHLYPTPHVRGTIPDSPDVLGDVLRSTLTSATIGYAAVFNEPKSNALDYRYESNRLWLGLKGLHIPVKGRFLDWNDITFDAMYAHEWQNYLDPSTEGPIILAGKPKQRRRKDHIDVFTLRMNARLFDLPQNRGTLASFLQWDLIADRSNIPVRDYNEFIISGGLTYSY